MRDDQDVGFVRGGWAARLGIVAMVVLLIGALTVAIVAQTPA